MKRSLIAWIAALAASMMLFGLSTSSPASAQNAADDPGQVEAGQVVYEASCAGCHAEDGTGVAGRGRPLTDIASQQEDRSVHIASITDGKGGMPAFGERLSGEEIDAAVSYLRLTFVAEPAAAAEEEPAALAETGAETPVVAIGGLALIGAGLMLTNQSRRIRRRN